MTFQRYFAMPNSETFSINGVDDYLRNALRGKSVIVDPFARNANYGTITNDLNPNTTAMHHKDTVTFLNDLVDSGVTADVVLFDPPYSPRQIMECYQAIGKQITMEDTQNGKILRLCRIAINQITRQGSEIIAFGWNTYSWGKGWKLQNVTLINHGGAHNDTIISHWIKTSNQQAFPGMTS